MNPLAVFCLVALLPRTFGSMQGDCKEAPTDEAGPMHLPRLNMTLSRQIKMYSDFEESKDCVAIIKTLAELVKATQNLMPYVPKAMGKFRKKLAVEAMKRKHFEVLPVIYCHVKRIKQVNAVFLYKTCLDNEPRFLEDNLAAWKIILELLIQKGVDMNFDVAPGVTPLSYAALKAHSSLVDLLLANGANPNRMNVLLFTPLIAALMCEDSKESRLHIVRMLIEKGARIKDKSPVFGPPLTVAIRADLHKAAKFLIDKGANIDEPFSAPSAMLSADTVQFLTDRLVSNDIVYPKLQSWTPLQVAFLERWFLMRAKQPPTIFPDQRCDLAEYLVRFGADVSPLFANDIISCSLVFGDSLISGAVKNYDISGARSLLKTALRRAERILPKMPTIDLHSQFLVEAKAALVHVFGRYSMPEESQTAVVKFAIEIGISSQLLDEAIAKQGLAYYHSAIKDGDVKHVAKLFQMLNVGPDRTRLKNPGYLILAAQSGHHNVLDYLLTSGIDVNSMSKGETALHFATSIGDPEAVKRLIARGANVDLLNEQKQTALHLAIENVPSTLFRDASRCGPRLACIKALCKASKNVNLKDGKERTALFVAVENMFDAAVPILLGNGADPIVRAVSDYPLHVAANYDNEDIARLLLENKASIEAKDALFHRTPLSFAMLRGSTKTAALLLHLGAQVDKNDFQRVIRSGTVEILRLVFGQAVARASPDDAASLKSLLVTRIKSESGDIEAPLVVNRRQFTKRSLQHTVIAGLYETLLEHFPEETQYVACRLAEITTSSSLLHSNQAAIYTKVIGLTKPLLDAELLSTAIAKSDEFKVNELIADDPALVERLNYFGNAPLIHAIFHREEGIACFLLKSKANPNVSSSFKNYPDPIEDEALEGSSALHLAILKRLPRAAELLIASGANVHARNRAGKTPLAFAIRHGAMPLVSILLDKGTIFDDHCACAALQRSEDFALTFAAKIDVKARCGSQTPLHVAAEKDYVKLSEQLIERKADIEAIDEETKLTPLQVAVINGSVEVATLLISRDAKVTVLDSDGNTLLHLPISKNERQMIKLLKEHLSLDTLNRHGKKPVFCAAANNLQALSLALIEAESQGQSNTEADPSDATKDESKISCCICFDPDTASPFHVLPCGHHFHRSCTLEWSRRSAICPTCKRPFDPSSLQ